MASQIFEIIVSLINLNCLPPPEIFETVFSEIFAIMIDITNVILPLSSLC
jgi:hypothetical protein